MNGPPGSSAAPLRPGAGIALLCLASLVAGLVLYTRHNDIPYYYHSDEPSKVNQVVGARGLNFKHPLLLMNTTRVAAALRGVDGDKQRAARVGRAVSAAFASLSVALLVLLAWMQRGSLAALLAAPILLGSHGLFTFAHFMKEDTALLLGISASLLAAAAFLRRPSAGRAALVGVACGLALSGKYIGALFPLAAIPLVALGARGSASERGRALALLAVGFAATVLLVNVTILFEWKRFLAGLAYETDHAATGGGKPFASILSLSYVYGLLSQSTWPVRILAAGWGAWVLATWRRRGADERMVTLFPALYLAILWASPIKAIRYLLPVVVLAHLFAGYALALLLERVPRGPARAAAALLALALVLAPQVTQLRIHLDAFARDSRLLLYDWVRHELPPDAHILQDRYAGLPDREWGYWTEDNAILSQKLTTKHFAPEVGDLDAMRAAGVEYVAVCSRAYDRFFGERKGFGSKAVRERFEARRATYEALFRRGELVFEAGHARVAGAPVDPEVRVYRIAEGGG